MKKFSSLKELLGHFEESELYKRYIKQEITNILESYGSDIVKSEDEHPLRFYDLEIDENIYKLGITSVEVEEDTGQDFYWIIE